MAYAQYDRKNGEDRFYWMVQLKGKTVLDFVRAFRAKNGIAAQCAKANGGQLPQEELPSWVFDPQPLEDDGEGVITSSKAFAVEEDVEI